MSSVLFRRQPSWGKRKGFVLVELLLTIGIMSSLSSIVILAVNPSRQIVNALLAKRESDMQEIAKAIQQYYIESGTYPSPETIPTGVDNALPICRNSIDFSTCINISELVPNYLPCVPYEAWGDGPFYNGYKLYKDSNGRINVATLHNQTTSLLNQGCDRMPLPGGYWDFEGGGATSVDQSGHGVTATELGSSPPVAMPYTFTSNFPNGYSQYLMGAAFQTSYFNLGNAPSLNFSKSDDFSIAAWILPGACLACPTMPIFQKRDVVSNNKGYRFGYDGTVDPPVGAGGSVTGAAHRLYFELVNDSSSNDRILVHTPTLLDGGSGWMHVAVSYDGSGLASGIKIYVNGVEQTLTVVANNLTGEITNSADVLIGGAAPVGGIPTNFTGFMDDVRSYDRVINTTVIQELVNGTL